MITVASIRRPGLRVQYLLSAMLLGLSIQLLTLHVETVRDMRDIGLPAALALPSIQHRMNIIKEQSEVAQLQASITGDSSEEMLRMYVLPDDTALDRLLATVDALTTELRKQGMLASLSPVQVGDETDADGFTKTPVSFEADVTAEGLKTLFLFQDLSGLLTVSDALTADEQTALLQLTEQENPAAITALETFLSMDLLTYAKAPQVAQDQLFRSFSSDVFTDSFSRMTEQSDLGAIVELLSGPLARSLEAQKLWPLRFLMPVKSAIRQTGVNQYHIAVTWEAYSR
ncbi:hypothetical protein K8942_05385 [Candidatus Peribacteria bacterium]|nr:MAG: hypothetical protein K8942_05385 [Candidatus Peribacteria bacterium]